MSAKGSTAIDFCVGRSSRLERRRSGAAGCAAVLCRSGRFACAVVVPEGPAAEQEQQRDDRELGAADALLAAVAVVPGEDEHDGQPDQEREGGELLELLWPVEGSLRYSRPCSTPQAPAT